VPNKESLAHAFDSIFVENYWCHTAALFWHFPHNRLFYNKIRKWWAIFTFLFVCREILFELLRQIRRDNGVPYTAPLIDRSISWTVNQIMDC
jgi:hypothetical protein